MNAKHTGKKNCAFEFPLISLELQGKAVCVQYERVIASDLAVRQSAIMPVCLLSGLTSCTLTWFEHLDSEARGKFVQHLFVTFFAASFF
jgi:hypothetical protein